MHYPIKIFYSEEDKGYIAVIPDLPGCSAFGETEEDTIREVKIAQELWLKTAKKEGRKIPLPSVDTHGLCRGYLPSEQREREREAPLALPVEGATQAP